MTQNSKETKTPDYIAYFVPARKNAPWVRFGAAWKNKDGEGFSIDHDFLPTGDGRIVMRSLESIQKNKEQAENQE